MEESFGGVLQTVLRPVGVKGFVVLPKRWIVERTFAWLACYSRYSKDYEKVASSSEANTCIGINNDAEVVEWTAVWSKQIGKQKIGSSTAH